MIRKTIMWAMIALIGAVVPVACSSDDNDEPDVPELPEGNEDNPMNLSPVQILGVDNLNKYSLMIAQDAISRADVGENLFVASLQVMNSFSILNRYCGMNDFSGSRVTIFGPSGAEYGFEFLTSKLMSYVSKPQDNAFSSYYGSVWIDSQIDRSGKSAFARYLSQVEKNRFYDIFDRPENNDGLVSGMNDWIKTKNPAGCLNFGSTNPIAGVHHALATDIHLVPKDVKTTEEHITGIFYVDQFNQTSYRPLITEHGYSIDGDCDRWTSVYGMDLDDGKSMMYVAIPANGVSVCDLAKSLTERDLRYWFSQTKNPDNKLVVDVPPFCVNNTSKHFSPDQYSILRLGLLNIEGLYSSEYPKLGYSASQAVHVSMDDGHNETVVIDSGSDNRYRTYPCVIIVVEKSTNAIQLFGLLYHI